MADENSPMGTFVFTSASIRYVAPSFTRSEIGHIMNIVSDQLCCLNHNAPPPDEMTESYGVYIQEVDKICGKIQDLCRYMDRFGIPEVLCSRG
jgi:hypothetical protein